MKREIFHTVSCMLVFAGIVLLLATSAFGSTPEERAYWGNTTATIGGDATTGRLGTWVKDSVPHLVVPCGVGLDWAFDVEVTYPTTVVTFTGSGSEFTEYMGDTFSFNGLVTFDQPGTYKVVSGSRKLLVTTTCER